jgi:hypothetical protein
VSSAPLTRAYLALEACLQPLSHLANFRVKIETAAMTAAVVAGMVQFFGRLRVVAFAALTADGNS